MNDKPDRMPNVPPFVKFVASAVPMVFDNSLSYYEALCALWKYVQGMTDVINNNATLEEEYIEKFDELKTFVDTYFDNLDVQEEINNKLDQMAEDGTLQEIITTYIQANVAWTFDTVADMKQATNLVAGSFARTLGFHTLGDDGGAIYKIEDTGTANEKNIITIGDLFAVLVSDKVNVKQFGAYGDNEHDDEPVINYAIQYAHNNDKNEVYLPAGEYIVHKAIVLPEFITLKGSDKHSTFIIKTTNDVDSDYSVDSVVIFKKSVDYSETYNNGQEIKDIQIKGNLNTTYGVYAQEEVPYTRIEECIIVSVDTGISYPKGGWLYGIYNTNINPRVNGIVINTSSINTTLSLNSTYVYGGSGYGYDLRGIIYSNFNNIACDSCTGVAYRFRYVNANINGLGCECTSATNAIVADHSYMTINSTTVIVNDNGSYTCLDLTNSELTVKNGEFSSQTENASLAGTFINQHSNAFITLEDCTLDKPYTTANTSSSDTNTITVKSSGATKTVNISEKFSGLGKITGATDSFASNANLEQEMGAIYFNVKGDPRYALDGTDRRWLKAFKLGDIAVNQTPELNGVALQQQSSESVDRAFTGTITATNISGSTGSITMSSLALESAAANKGIIPRARRYIASSSGGSAYISSINYGSNMIGLNYVTGTFSVGDTLTYKGTPDFDRAKFNGIAYVNYGSTAERPSQPVNGLMYFDTTLNKPIWYKGSSTWVDATGTTV